MAYDKELAFAKDLANQAGDIMKKYYRADQQVEIKSDNTPVTIADKTVNDLVIEKIQSTFPDDGVMGEEASWHTDSERLWVCDPIDGTIGYTMRIPTSMFSLALVIDGRSVLAVAYNPRVNELYYAVQGEGAFMNSQPIRVSSRAWGEGTRITTSSHEGIFHSKGLVQSLKEQKVYVHALLGLVHQGCLIAEGAIDGRIFLYNGAHDIAAVKLIIEEAGGKVTDLEGNEQRYDQPINGAIMSNGLIHNKLLEIYANSRD